MADDELMLLMFDLDGSEQVNDTLGHNTGDQVIDLFARVLREQSHPSDVIARAGGAV